MGADRFWDRQNGGDLRRLEMQVAAGKALAEEVRGHTDLFEDYAGIIRALAAWDAAEREAS